MNILNHPSLKLICYLGTLIFFQFINESAKLGYDEVVKFTWWDWLKFCAGLIAPAMLIIRAYTDSSLSRHILKKSNIQVP